jgi:hypothetical protein
MPLWIQGNINIAIQTVTIKSGFVFPDGSRSLGPDHSLNGCYSAFALTGGFGVGAGCRIWGPFGISFTADRVSRGLDTGRTPEYYQYDDNNDIGTSGYIPRDLGNSSATASDNSISNDFRGWRFTAGLVFMPSTQ